MHAYTYPYLSAHQSRVDDPTEWQMELAGALEAIFKTTHDLDEVVKNLNESHLRHPTEGTWNNENFRSLMKQLGS